MNYEIEMMKYANRLKVISNNKDIGIEHKKNKKTFLMGAEVTLNSKGFRGNELKNETKKILMLGDSMTFGWGAKNPFPNILDKNTAKEGEITGMYLIDEEGILETRDVNARFVNGKPEAIEAIYIMKSPEAWDRFMRFMERYGQSNGLVFTKAN